MSSSSLEVSEPSALRGSGAEFARRHSSEHSKPEEEPHGIVAERKRDTLNRGPGRR
jgi:hypothetical protein